MKRFIVAVLVASLTGCYAEFDVPKTPRSDCVGKVQDQYLYVMPTCRELPKKHPKDFELQTLYIYRGSSVVECCNDSAEVEGSNPSRDTSRSRNIGVHNVRDERQAGHRCAQRPFNA